MGLPQPTSFDLTLLPIDCFARIARQPGSVWLDSSLTRGGWGERSLLAFNPVGGLTLDGGRGRIDRAGHDSTECGRETIFDELERIRHDRRQTAVGYVAYEACLPWLDLTSAKPDAAIPEVRFHVYDRVLWYDHVTNEFSDPDLALEFLETIADGNSPVRLSQPGEAVLKAVTSKATYLARVGRVKQHIREGDIYQANYTCRFDGTTRIDPFIAYLRLRRFNPASYSAYLNFGDYRVLSSSPERMLRWVDDRITSSPIKGTIAVGRDPLETEANRMRLLHSEKDRAELLMIVDLVRNDLGKIAERGGVTVESLYRPEVYSSLIHLVADISARVRPGCTVENVLAALLPGGSITGAPKRRAVEILGELEDTSRSVYTGSIGYIGQGRADFNIAIRTMIHRGQTYRVHAGGGIVADSDPEKEYDEMLLKAHNLFRAIGATV